MTLIKQYEVFEDSGPVFLARVLGASGAAITQTDVSTITYTSVEADDPGTEITGGSLVVSSIVYDTLQTDSRWNVDTTGYNFAHQVPAAAIPTGGKYYIIQYLLTMASGPPIILETRLKTHESYHD